MFVGLRISRAAYPALLAALCLGAAGCGLRRAAAPYVPSAVFAPSDANRARDSYIAEGRDGMIASAHPLATRAGIRMLKAGGNAVDAAAAVSFALSVLRPQSTGLGGGGFILVYDPSRRKTIVYDCRERAPMAATRDMYVGADGRPLAFKYGGAAIPRASINGHRAVGTPGLVAGLVEVHRRHGRLPLKVVMRPAINLAENGFPVYPGLADAIARRSGVMTRFEGTREIFFRQGRPLAAGETLVQKDLARTLRRIAEHGADGFYRGPVAERIVAEMKRGGGLITLEDLATYRVRIRRPVEGRYRGHRIVSMPPPSSGGVHIVQMLNMLSGYDVKGLGHETAAGTHVLAEVMRRAFADRAKYLGDPDFVTVPVRGLTHPAYARSRRATIDLERATPSKTLGAGDAAAYESASTTHLSVVDRWGGAVSSTQTINFSFGSCVVAAGTGVVLNDEMDDFSIRPGAPNVYGLVGGEANAIAARKTMLSSMSPTFVFGPGGRLKMVLGSPGGPRIINATLQTILNVIDHHMSLPDAVHAYRIHHQWLPDVLSYEKGGLAEEVRRALRVRGHLLFQRPPIGDVQAIIRTRRGWLGVSDTRGGGRPMGLEDQ